MSRRKKNKAGLHKKVPSVFNGVPVRQNDDVRQPGAAPEQQRAGYNEPEPEQQELQTSKLQMKRTFRQHGFIAWSKRKKAKAMAKMEERLKAESQARTKAEERLKAEIETRASAERKVKAEAEKMLLTQYRKYSVLAERAEAQAKKEIAAAKAEAKEAVEKAQSYAAAVAQAEKKTPKEKEQARTEP